MKITYGDLLILVGKTNNNKAEFRRLLSQTNFMEKILEFGMMDKKDLLTDHSDEKSLSLDALEKFFRISETIDVRISGNKKLSYPAYNSFCDSVLNLSKHIEEGGEIESTFDILPLNFEFEISDRYDMFVTNKFNLFKEAIGDELFEYFMDK